MDLSGSKARLKPARTTSPTVHNLLNNGMRIKTKDDKEEGLAKTLFLFFCLATTNEKEARHRLQGEAMRVEESVQGCPAVCAEIVTMPVA